MHEHGATPGQVYISGILKSLGLRVQRRRVRSCLARLDPENRVLRWGIIVSRGLYQVPWPNSLWHGNACIDGFSRRIMYLKCSSNNLSETWPSRIRVDRGVENTIVCDAMVQYRREGRASFIAGPSTHN